MKYSFLTTLKKTLVRIALVGIPLLLQFLPSEVQNLTVGAVLLIVYDYLKHGVELKFLP
jgi:hypothetical protein